MFSQKNQREKREAVIRSSLLEKLKEAVQSLLQPTGGNKSIRISSGLVLGHSDNTNILCNIIEAVFIHGLRDSFGEKMSTLFLGDPDRMPVPNFWPVILIISHRDLLEQVDQLSFITSEVGKGRAWIRLALNQSQVSSYLSVLSGDNRTLKEYYRTNACLRDTEYCDIMLRVLQPVSSMPFNLATNAAVLNTWTQTPLILAGVWTPTSILPSSHQDPVMGATDVASTVYDECTRGITIPEPDNPISDVMFQLIIGGTPETSFISDHISSNEGTLTEADKARVNDLSGFAEGSDEPRKMFTDDTKMVAKQDGYRDPIAESSRRNDPQSEEVVASIRKQLESHHKRHTGDSFSDELDLPYRRRYTGDSLTDNESLSTLSRSISLIQDAPAYRELFSAFETDEDALIGVPSLLANIVPDDEPEPEVEDKNESFTSLEDAINLNFEILPKQFLQGEETSRLLPMLIQLTNEQGLDSQRYQCNSCEAYIGMLYGKPRVCSYDSRYYCNDCHEGEMLLIPARVVHNWDLSTHPVSIANRKWLASVYHQPLIDLRTANPRLYCHVDNLSEMQSLRRQLLYLRAYLMTCRSGVEQELRKKLWPREYIYEHVHLYSVFDLQLISTGQLVPSVRHAVVWGRRHVLGCSVCAPRGFICELCDKDEIIYPFQIGNTHTCNSCFAVFHYNCARTQSCPRCKRIKKRRDAQDPFIPSIETLS